MAFLTTSAATMKQGANRRTSAELCIIKLCTPSLDSDMNAILRRLSELETSVATGKVNVNAEVTAPAVKEPKTQSEVNPEPVETTTPPKPEPVKEEPKSVNNAVKQPSPAPQKSETIVPETKETVPFGIWPEVLEKLFSKDPSLIAMLTGSSAFIHNNKYLLIKGSPVLELYLKTGDYSKVIRETVAEVTGKTYTLAVYNNKQEEAPSNPLSDLVAKAKSLGVKIEEE